MVILTKLRSWQDLPLESDLYPFTVVSARKSCESVSAIQKISGATLKYLAQYTLEYTR